MGSTFSTIQLTDTDIIDITKETGCKYENIKVIYETCSKVTAKALERNEKYPLVLEANLEPNH